MIPSLPTEIIREIIQFSLPPLIRTNHRERYDLLLAYSLVAKVWKIIAQEELIKHLFLRVSTTRCPEKVNVMINMELSRRKESGLISKVISVRLVNTSGYSIYSNTTKASIDALFKKLVDVEEIWIVGFDFSMMAFEKFIDWQAFTRLNKLHFIRNTVESLDNMPIPKVIKFTSSHASTLTHLTLMSIYNFTNGPLFNSLLQSSIFPSLTSFAYIANHGPDERQAISEIPESIAKQLKKLLVYDRSGSSRDALMSKLSKFSSLESLSLLDVNSLKSNFRIPSSLNNLLIARIHYSFVEEFKILKDWIQAVDHQQQLRSISFPILSRMNLGNEEALKDLTNFTSERGIKIIYSNYKERNEEHWRELFDFAFN